MKYIFKYTIALAAALSLAACGEKKFHVSGTISDAADSTLYFENVALDGLQVVDSVKLGSDGSFDFSAEASEAPEFYRLRIAGQIINVAIDSTETVTVNAKYSSMATDYTIEGSEQCNKIKELTLKQIDLQNKAIQIQNNGNLTRQVAADSITKMIEAYKQEVKMNYIFKEPKASSSYFALFQTIGNFLIFNPRTSKDDIKVFAAVATSWDTFYPGSLRGKNLHNIAIEGMKNERIVASENADIQVDASKVSTAGVIDIDLIDNKGKERKLSDLTGKVVLLDFHIFATEDSPKRILMMRELYNKYHAQGFEIYQISLDPNEHFWKQQTAALPWISVRDENGVNSQIINLYNVQGVPDFFLIDKSNSLVKRAAQIKDLEKEIAALL